MNESREHARYDKKMIIEYSFPVNNILSSSKGRVYNISLGGIYMVTEYLVDKDSKVEMMFSIVKDDELIILKTNGNVLRSGTVISDSEINKKYKLTEDDGNFFAVVKFEEPFVELSFMLH